MATYTQSLVEGHFQVDMQRTSGAAVGKWVRVRLNFVAD
ncbi:hypothetical protein ABI_35610 [Asticcacaulis biprosthecium C19]|uniref:Uncharacterized protein n=2 Tax=Asticcacaulis biprosthecium TaxID=76891 RepID=F4QQQ1_9CAUL|nr:hypothetical protein ABI_35610 [Asticcacaulis biprosthecium C19]